MGTDAKSSQSCGDLSYDVPRRRNACGMVVLRRSIGAMVLGLLPLTVAAQAPLRLDQTTSETTQEKLGGTPAIDMITLRAIGPGTPLRFGNVVVGSERITLDGRVLHAGTDYAMDNATGVVYLKVPQKAGQSLVVAYRYSDKPDPEAAKTARALSGFKFDLLPGGLSLVSGLGFAERTADGKVMTGNALGFQNAFKFNGGSMSGLYVYSNREKSSNSAGLNFDNSARPGDAGDETGSSQAILQNLSSNALGGKVSIDYQDVGKNFAAFQTARESGADDATVNRLRSERGLTRLGFSADDLKVGGLGFSSGFRNIKDDNGSIEWRNYGVKSGGFTLNYTSQEIDQNFARFKDIAEKDKAILERERGLKRENWAGSLDAKVGKLSFNSSTIADAASGNAVKRTEYGLDAKQFKFNMGRQDVDAGWNRTASLFDQEKARYGMDAGLSRQWMALESSVLGKGTTLGFRESILEAGSGNFRSRDAVVSAKTWSLNHSSRAADSGFNGFNGFNRPDEANGRAEADNHIGSIAAMYGPGAAVRPEDRAAFNLSAGIDRSFTSLSAQPFKGWKAEFTSLTLTGTNDSGRVQSASLEAGKVKMQWRKQNLGDQFDEFSRLMSFERTKLGNIAGLDRTEFGLQMDLGRGRSLTASSMGMDSPNGGAKRTSLAYNDKRLEINVNAREVDSGFTNINNLVDPEKDFLATLQGYAQRDGKLKWQILPNFKIEGTMYEAVNDQLDIHSRIRNLALDWKVDPRTQLTYYAHSQSSNDPVNILFANETQRITLTRDLGALGRIAFHDERINYGGTQTNLVDSHRQYMAYQTNLSKSTDFKSEQTRTVFANGTEDRVSTNSVSTSVAKNFGVSVSDVDVDRHGDDSDERRRNYGFWYDFGKGLRFSYGYARQLVGENSGTMQSSIALGENAVGMQANQAGSIKQANVGGLMIGGAQGINTWDADGRTQGFTNFALSVAKPFRLGPLNDVKLHMGMDTASDRAKYLKENQLFQFSGVVAGAKVGYEYVGQMHQSGIRGIDRAFRFESDANKNNFLSASVFYKVRTLPWDDQIMIRNFNFTMRPSKALELVHKLETNPEQARGDVILGSIPVAARSSRWELNYKKDKNLTLGASWVELINDQSNALTRTGGVNMTLFESTGSPLSLYYGVEQAQGNIDRRTQQRYHLRFDQRPGPNQMLNFFVGNISYEGAYAENQRVNNWSFRLNYQLKF